MMCISTYKCTYAVLHTMIIQSVGTTFLVKFKYYATTSLGSLYNSYTQYEAQDNLGPESSNPFKWQWVLYVRIGVVPRI